MSARFISEVVNKTSAGVRRGVQVEADQSRGQIQCQVMSVKQHQ